MRGETGEEKRNICGYIIEIFERWWRWLSGKDSCIKALNPHLIFVGFFYNFVIVELTKNRKYLICKVVSMLVRWLLVV